MNISGTDRMMVLECRIWEQGIDDWYIPESCLERLSENEYQIYLEGCAEDQE